MGQLWLVDQVHHAVDVVAGGEPLAAQLESGHGRQGRSGGSPRHSQ